MPFLLPHGPAVQPLINVSFLLAVAAAAWWGGTVSGILVSLTAVLVFTFIGTHGQAILPRNPNFTAILILLGVAVLVSQVAKSRRRAEEILRGSNKLLEEKVNERTAALERAHQELLHNNEELRHFAYAVSHDLQQPLRGVILNTQLLHRMCGDKLDGDEATVVQNIVSGASRLDALIRDLLQYTQILGDEQPRAGAANFNQVLETVLSNLSEVIQSSEATILCHNPPAPCVSTAHLQQLLQNLISNPLKYRSDKPPVINIDSERVGNQWLVRVSDNGIGIDSEYHQRIFMPFNRLHSREKYSGTGLGLALCQRIVQRYGGRIWVESQVGQGSTFSFTLPAEKLDASSFTAPS